MTIIETATDFDYMGVTPRVSDKHVRGVEALAELGITEGVGNAIIWYQNIGIKHPVVVGLDEQRPIRITDETNFRRALIKAYSLKENDAYRLKKIVDCFRTYF